MGEDTLIIRKIVCLPIKLYQYFISPLLQPCCRFYPSCSVYAESAISTYGLGKGLWLAAKRICRCNPWSPGGYDPVLPKNEKI